MRNGSDIELTTGDGRCFYCSLPLADHDVSVVEDPPGIQIFCPAPPGEPTHGLFQPASTHPISPVKEETG